MKPIIAVPATAALVYRAWSRKSLTPLGIAVATITAIAHAIHPWSVFFALLSVFFLTGTAVTKVKHDVKSRLTHSSSGSPGGEGPRTHIQVLANSLAATILIPLHAWVLSENGRATNKYGECWSHGRDVLVIGIVANYAAVAADTFSSELGILSSSPPRLITAPWRVVPKGTNGGVTIVGLGAGLLGSFIVSLTSAALMPFCPEPSLGNYNVDMNLLKFFNPGWHLRAKTEFILSMTLLGLCGSLLDSLLGAAFQASVVDVRSGLIIEGTGGGKVPIHSSGTAQLQQDGVRKRGKSPANKPNEIEQKLESRRVEFGYDILSNNGVNFVMALSISFAGIVLAMYTWDVSMDSILTAG